MKEKILILILIFAAGLLYAGAKSMRDANLLPDSRQDKIFDEARAGETTLRLEIADSSQERVKGLSGRDSLNEDGALLFIFPKEGEHGIWMKEMNFAIDIIWLDGDYKIVGLKKDARPESYPEVFRPRAPAKYILEMNSGIVEAGGIEIGQTVKFF